MPANFYRNGNMAIQRVDGGYVLTITGSADRTILLIRNDGGMIDTSGAPVDKTDRMVASMCLPHVGGEHLVPLLHQAKLTPEAAEAIKQRMIPKG